MTQLFNSILRVVPAIYIVLFMLFLTGCGGDGNDDPTPTRNSNINRQLTGTVATGNPVAGTVDVVDRNGETLQTQSDANGKYAVNLEGRPGPYLIRAVPNDTELPTLFSYATGEGVVNCTQFTTLALFLANRSDLSLAFADWSTQFANWDRRSIEEALATINANFATELESAGVDPTLYDFFRDAFEADHTGMDAFLDNHSVFIDFAAATFNIQSSAQIINFDEVIDVTGYFIGAKFLPDDTASWDFTWATDINGKENTATFSVSTADVPWNQDLFNEIFWTDLGISQQPVTRCQDVADTNCNITFSVTGLGSSYDVIGDGEVGTTITGSASYSWRITGWYTVNGQRDPVDQSHSFSFSWTWKRTA